MKYNHIEIAFCTNRNDKNCTLYIFMGNFNHFYHKKRFAHSNGIRIFAVKAMIHYTCCG
jgi:hypothetical protein